MDAVETASQPQIQAAREAVAEVRPARVIFKDYVYVVRQVPKVLQHHGLGQTLCWLYMRGGDSATSPYDLVFRQLDRWVHKAMGVAGRGALTTLAGRDSRFYREASEQAWLFVRALGACVEEAK